MEAGWCLPMARADPGSPDFHRQRVAVRPLRENWHFPRIGFQHRARGDPGESAGSQRPEPPLSIQVNGFGTLLSLRSSRGEISNYCRAQLSRGFSFRSQPVDAVNERVGGSLAAHQIHRGDLPSSVHF